MNLPSPRRAPSAWALGTLVAGLAFMRFVPRPEPGTALFLLGAGWLTWLSWNRRAAPQPDGLVIIASREQALWLLLALGVAAALGLAAGHPIEAIAKSAVPFLVLVWAMFVVVPQVGSTLLLEKFLIVAGSVWAVRLILAGALEFLDGSSLKWLRLTLVDADAVVPFPLIVLPLVLFSSQPLPRGWRATALLLQLIVVVWAGYRSQQLLVLAMLALALGRLAWRRPSAFAAAAVVLAAAGGLGASALQSDSETSLLASQLERYAALKEEGAVSGRALERRFALDRFTDYPLLGAGLGIQVPASITYASTEIEEDYDLPETVSYLHNATFYLLMCGGLPLLLAYMALWLTGLRHCGSLWVRVALLALLAFIQVEATFLQVHFSVLLALLVGLRHSAAPVLQAGAVAPVPDYPGPSGPDLAKDS